MFMLAAVVGFLGPFGTYLDSTLAERVEEWWLQLMGAYLFVRPWIAGLRWLSVKTALPVSPLVMSGVIAASVPLAILWRQVGQDAYRELDGYAGLIPFGLLCALAVLGVEIWARQASERLASRPVVSGEGTGQSSASTAETPICPVDGIAEPRLLTRLPASFESPILAIQSEDHYVRVHGPQGSDLVLLRLRDAIAEMDGCDGEQIHRSWWVARGGIASVAQSGRACSIRLQNGAVAPVARESIGRLQKAGFL